MRAGKLNTRIVIERKDLKQDGAGQLVETWVNVAHAWAWVRGATGIGTIRLLGQSEGVPMSANYSSVRIRPRTDVVVGMRVRLRVSGRLLDIKNIARDEERGEWCDLVCEEVNGQS